MASIYSRYHAHVTGKQGQSKCTMIIISNHNITVNKLVQTTVSRECDGGIYILYANYVLFYDDTR